MTTAEVKMGGSNKTAMPREQQPIDNADDPRGQFAAFLRDWVSRQAESKRPFITRTTVYENLAKELGLAIRAVQKWSKGKSGPNLGDLDRVAKAMGFKDWSLLASAVVAFSKKRRK